LAFSTGWAGGGGGGTFVYNQTTNQLIVAAGGGGGAGKGDPNQYNFTLNGVDAVVKKNNFQTNKNITIDNSRRIQVK
jgi:hypothetical protein